VPLEVIYLPKQKSIWEEINPFIEKLVGAYKQSQETKWNNEWQLSAIADIEKANKPQDVNSFLEMQKIPEENLELEKFKVFAQDAVTLLQQEKFTGIPQIKSEFTPGDIGIKEGDLIPNVKEFNELYKYVSELPTGKVDWTNTLNLFKEKLESGRAMGTAAQQFLSMIMGQSMPTDERQKVQQDVAFTQDLKNIFFPETIEKQPSSELEYWLREHPEQGVEDYWKAKKEPETTFNWQKFLEDNPDWQIKTINSKGDVSVGRKDTTKAWDFDSWKEAKQWTETHKQEGFIWKIDPVKEGFSVTSVKETVKPEGGTDKVVPTYDIINRVRQDLYAYPEQRDSILNNFSIKYKTEGVDLPSVADVAKWTYGAAGEEIRSPENEYIDEKGVVKDEFAYRDFYTDYEQYAKQYFEETGTILPKKYLSIEEAGKYESIEWAKGKYKGGQKPIFNTENIPWSWLKDFDSTKALFNEMQRSGLTPQDYDLEALAKEQGIDIQRLLKMFEK